MARLHFCTYEKCIHWGQKSRYPRKCYYKRQCWRGKLDELLGLVPND